MNKIWFSSQYLSIVANMFFFLNCLTLCRKFKRLISTSTDTFANFIINTFVFSMSNFQRVIFIRMEQYLCVVKSAYDLDSSSRLTFDRLNTAHVADIIF